MVRVVVIGAGVIGVSTAFNLRTSLPDAEVILLAEKTVPDITSSVAAGIWVPHALQDTPATLINRWSKVTWDYLDKLRRSPERGSAGVSLISGYYLFKEPQQEINHEGWETTVKGFRSLTPEELSEYPGYNSGWFFTTHICDPTRYIPWLFQKFRNLGGEFVQRRVDKIEELSEEYDIVVNCTGVEATRIIEDSEAEPIRGQVIKVDAPWIKHFIIMARGDNYIIPLMNGLTLLGGTHQQGNWNWEVDERDSEEIQLGCSSLVPSLRTAKVVKKEVGLRPGRTRVRLALEYRQYKGRRFPVVHNYGHGGSGVTLHWGCATEAARLVQQALRDFTSKL